jgi:hypothetical protein
MWADDAPGACVRTRRLLAVLLLCAGCDPACVVHCAACFRYRLHVFFLRRASTRFIMARCLFPDCAALSSGCVKKHRYPPEGMEDAVKTVI